MRNNKGFTLIEILATMAILAILMGITLQTYSKYVGHTKNKAYRILSESAVSAAENYLLEYPTAGNEIDIADLVEDGYLENATDPNSSDRTCRGKVIVTENKNSGKLDDNDYKVILCCMAFNGTYDSKTKQQVRDDTCKLD